MRGWHASSSRASPPDQSSSVVLWTAAWAAALGATLDPARREFASAKARPQSRLCRAASAKRKGRPRRTAPIVGTSDASEVGVGLVADEAHRGHLRALGD